MRIAVEHPLKIDPVINLRRQPDDLFVVVVASRAASTPPSSQVVSMDDLTRSSTRAPCFHIDEVIKPAFFVFRLSGEETQSRQHALARDLSADPAALRCDQPAVKPNRSRRCWRSCPAARRATSRPFARDPAPALCPGRCSLAAEGAAGEVVEKAMSCDVNRYAADASDERRAGNMGEK